MISKSTTIHPILFAIFPILLIITSNLDEVFWESKRLIKEKLPIQSLILGYERMFISVIKQYKKINN